MADVAEISFLIKAIAKRKEMVMPILIFFFNLSKTSVELKNTSHILS